MTRIVTIEIQNDSAFEQIKTLAYKLGAKMREEPLFELGITGEHWAKDIQPKKGVNQNELAKNVLALQERFKNTYVDPNINLSALADEMLGE